MPNGGIHFRVWAPNAASVKLVLDHPDSSRNSTALNLNAEIGGYWSASVDAARPGMTYRFDLGLGDQPYPDPASRYQPEGPHGPSLIVDSSFPWTDQHWDGIPEQGRVLYEMHIGTFTIEGTYRAAARELPELAQLGITVIQLMPLSEFDGDFGWGYDGVDFYAPYHKYGSPDDLRSFIDQAHNLGIGVILDVVYNHCGASGCFLPKFSREYFSETYQSEWGEVFNFDGENNQPVREFIISNAIYWITEFHFDGFRLDATQQIFDASKDHIIAALAREARKAAGNRALYIIAENEPQHCHLVYPSDEQGYGLDGLLNDDFHHAATVALKGWREAYFLDYKGEPQEFISSSKYGYLYQGQWYAWQKQNRGTPSFGLEIDTFVHFLQNHDQVANTGLGNRLHVSSHPALYRAFTALLLLGPATPLLFQGQEFCATSPFLYFADHKGELANMVHKGRSEFLQQFPSLAAPETAAHLLRPDDPAAFNSSKLDLLQRTQNAGAYQLHKDLLRLRREDPVFSHRNLAGVDGAVLSGSAFVLRYFSHDRQQDRLLLINMGCDLAMSPLPQPLLAPPLNATWEILWCSEHPQYDGHGTVPLNLNEKWVLPGLCALVLQPCALLKTGISEEIDNASIDHA